MTPPRMRQPSRPDMRAEPDSTPPGEIDLSAELEQARAGRERAPWWASLLFKKLSVDEQFRRAGARLGELEDGYERHEAMLTGTQRNNEAIAEERRKRREKWGDRIWVIVAGALLALILWGAQWLHCSPPTPSTKVEVHP